MSAGIPVFQQDDSVAMLKVHPLRIDLYEELHNRPSPVIAGPCQITHFTLLLNEGATVQEYIGDLCKRFGVAVPHSSASCSYQDFGCFELRWERHLEFTNLTFIFATDDPYVSDPFSHIPRDWLAAMPGELLVALNLVFVEQEPTDKQLQQWFEGQRISGADIYDGKAKIWTAFKLHSNGLGRILAYNKRLTQYQNGRLVQRLFELETYRVMALMALPVARRTSSELRQIENRLTDLHNSIADIQVQHNERELLQELSLLAARVEQLRSATNYRFAAAIAYNDLVQDRLLQLRETALEGMQIWREFLERRFTPGIKTCISTRDRLEDVSRRISSTTGLLRARVDLSIQEQNQRLLSSMNKRSLVQLRLQQTVEGLSVVAISYYLVSLLGFVYQGLSAYGLTLDVDMAKGLSAPFVLGCVYYLVRRLRVHITRRLPAQLGD